jgi:Raf kinase inhibitor-like YbhB/YbcL family protein
MRLILALAASLLVAGCGRAESNDAAAPAPAPPAKALALNLAAAAPTAGLIKVASDAVGADGSFDRRYTSYGDNLSPPLSWTPVTAAATYAVVLEDPDAHSETPFVHWLIWGIPAAATSLPAGIAGGPKATAPGGAIQGLNGVGDVGYYGPHPPAGTGVHHYHLEVFALDGPLKLTPDAGISQLTAAMKGHVIAGGELVGTFAAPAAP